MMSTACVYVMRVLSLFIMNCSWYRFQLMCNSFEGKTKKIFLLIFQLRILKNLAGFIKLACFLCRTFHSKLVLLQAWYVTNFRDDKALTYFSSEGWRTWKLKMSACLSSCLSVTIHRKFIFDFTSGIKLYFDTGNSEGRGRVMGRGVGGGCNG